MSKKTTQSEKVATILKRLGPTKEAEAEIVKRLKMNPHTAHFYRWRYERTGSVLKSPTRKKGSRNLRGAVAQKKADKKALAKIIKKSRRQAKRLTKKMMPLPEILKGVGEVKPA